MALCKFKRGWRQVEVIEAVKGVRLVCDSMVERQVASGLRRTPTPLVAIVTAMKALIVAGITSTLLNGLSEGMPGLQFACYLLLGTVATGYTLFGFYPLVFGEFVFPDGVKVMPLSAEESALLQSQIKQNKAQEGDEREERNPDES